MPTITIPDDLYARLAERAARLGLSVEQLVLPTLRQEGGVAHPRPTPEQIAENMKALERLNRFIDSLPNRYPPGFVVDDSRESIYREREDAQL